MGPILRYRGWGFNIVSSEDAMPPITVREGYKRPLYQDSPDVDPWIFLHKFQGPQAQFEKVLQDLGN